MPRYLIARAAALNLLKICVVLGCSAAHCAEPSAKVAVANVPANALACNTAETAKSLQLRYPTLIAAFAATIVQTSSCTSIVRVMDLLANRDKLGGRKLLTPKALDRAAAKQELERTMADPEVRKRWDAALASEPDKLRQRVLFAALMDDEGAYNARDLVVEELLQGGQP